MRGLKRAVIGCAALCGACGLVAPERASTVSGRVDRLFFGLVGLSALITLFIGGLILYFGIKYRAGSAASRAGELKRPWRLELVWIGFAALVSLGIFFWAATVYIEITTPPSEARVVYVVGKQWMWKFHHPGGPEEINELHVPAGEDVRLVLFSQDVIHSFFVPAFRLKQDALPGRYTSLWFRASRPGRYLMQCAEYCGAEHSQMRGEVIVMSPVDFERWLSAAALGIAPVPGTPGTSQGPLALRGRGGFYRFGCNACHLEDAAIRAPRLDGLYGREVRLQSGQSVMADEQYLREAILEPNAKIVAGYTAPSLMPTYKGQLSEAEVRELIELIRSIREGWPSPTVDPKPRDEGTAPREATEKAGRSND